MGVLVAVDAGRAAGLAGELGAAGLTVVGITEPTALAEGAAIPPDVDVLVVQATRRALTAAVIDACDGAGVRIVPLCATVGDRRIAAAFGVGPALPLDVDGWAIRDSLRRAAPAPADVADVADARPSGPRVIAVWGPAGSPGRSTLAIELAAALCDGRRVCLVDADTHAPSLALLLGLADEGPGLATVCRRVAAGDIDVDDLERASTPLAVAGGTVDVLPGINRPSRWPELSAARVTGALQACARWAAHTVVDVAASLERDEEIVSDLSDGPRRNAATLAALQGADHVVAVLAADPLGVARFVRAHAELRAVVGATPITVVANRLRPGTMGIDARGQVRRTLERFAGITDVVFVPQDPRAVDAGILSARPVADVAPRSPLSQSVRHIARALMPAPTAAPRGRRMRRTVVGAATEP